MFDRLLYRIYAHRLERELRQNPGLLPRHIGVILDGNRRWAKQMGTQTAQGHQMGAEKILEFLDWSSEMGIEVVTLWVLSTDNLQRSTQELQKLFDIICYAVEKIADQRRWQLRLLGDLDLLPEKIQQRLKQAALLTPTQPAGMSTKNKTTATVNIAVGYGGREEITAAVRSLLQQRAQQGEDLTQVANNLTVDDITDHMYTRGQPDPDLVIRTSGEQRLSGFLLWQSAHSEFYFCEAYWPDFRKIDFLRALRDFSQRERRLGK